MSVVLAITLIVVVLAFYLSWLAGRLDRLHRRVDSARATLDSALLRRATLALDVAGAAPGPAAGQLADAARTVTVAADPRDSDLENGLAAALDDVCESPSSLKTVERARVEALTDACFAAVLARHFYNDAVRDTLAIRSKRVVKWLRLAGRAPAPEYAEFDDRVPPTLIPFRTGATTNQ